MEKKYYWNELAQDSELIRLTADDFVKLLDCYYGNIFVADGNGYILYLNKAYYTTLGIPREKLIGKHVSFLKQHNMFNRSITLEVLDKKKEVIGPVMDKNGDEIFVQGIPIFNDQQEVMMVLQFAKSGNEIEMFRKQIYEAREKADKYMATIDYITNFELAKGSILYKSGIMHKIKQIADKIAVSDSAVLIYGESGTGKEVIAKYIFDQSNRSKEPFIPVNCSAIPEGLLESEFFGYAKGAFTGALKDGKPGLFELAHKGTLFLDEIGELCLPMQSKLLRVLETGEVMRVGDIRPKKVDARIICATNRNLEQMIKDNLFREDLYYRLNVITLNVPPLRKRSEDIEVYAKYFLSVYNQKYKSKKRLSKNAINQLQSYRWPGNVRELKNLMHRLTLTVESDLINEVPGLFGGGSNEPISELPEDERTLKEAVREFEKQYILKTLQKCGNNVTKAADKLGIHRSFIYRKLGEEAKHY